MIGKMSLEFYYNIALTPAVYREIHSLGYRWVNNMNDMYLLARSINRAGANWEVILEQLRDPNNQRAYCRGPCAREAWISEVQALADSRKKPHDWLTDRRHWTEKLRDSLAQGELVSTSESLAILHQCEKRQFG